MLTLIYNYGPFLLIELVLLMMMRSKGGGGCCGGSHGGSHDGNSGNKPKVSEHQH